MNNVWYIAIIISVLFHATVLGGTSHFFYKRITAWRKQKTKEVKITPARITKENELATKKNELTKKRKVDVDPPKPIPFIDNIMTKLIDNDFSTIKRQQILDRKTDEVVFMGVPSEEELKKNPAYRNYCRLMREKIRANTYQKYTNARKGEIFARFLVDNNGVLKGVRLGSESASNKTLRDIVLQSIEEAAPFPAFPKELAQYSQLQFSIAIYFKKK